MLKEYALLTTREMAEVDRLAVAAGVSSLDLMEAAGRAVADAAEAMVRPPARIAILCGPGNNGGDGFVTARLLQLRGFDVAVGCLVERDRLKGDAAAMARRWSGGVEECSQLALDSCDLIIDALFGAGLSRPLEGEAAALVAQLGALSGGPAILAIDVPSGLDGSTGNAPLGPDGQPSHALYKATRTVTFFRAKPGHLLLPGRRLCGALTVADIGIAPALLASIGPQTCRNEPALWRHAFPVPGAEDHKYARGHVVVVSGPPARTGAARLAAYAALRAGAGLVTVASPQDAVVVNASHLTAVMVAPFDVPEGLATIMADARITTLVIGPGCGVGEDTRRMVEIALTTKAAVVLDADALTSFADDPAELFAMIQAHHDRGQATVLTPHQGEFRRLFAALPAAKLEAARQAARTSMAVIISKGADTVIADPDGRAAINCNAPPYLATAGAGDVLAGIIAGLLAQGMPAWHAASAAVWMHGACATSFGPGLIAEDLAGRLSEVLQKLFSLQH